MTSPTTPPTKPVSGKTSRSTSSAASRRASDPEARFTRNVTIAFVAIVVAVAVVVLIGLAYGFWESNLKPLANVNGTQIGRGEWEDRQRLDAFRADRTETATRAALLAGEIDEDLANTRLTAASNVRNAGAAGAMETLVDLHLKEQLADEQGVTLSEEELAAALAADGTLPESRRIAALVVQPLGSATGQATAEDTAAARAKADEALAALSRAPPSPTSSTSTRRPRLPRTATSVSAPWTTCVPSIRPGPSLSMRSTRAASRRSWTRRSASSSASSPTSRRRRRMRGSWTP